jgi:hypothetical protein
MIGSHPMLLVTPVALIIINTSPGGDTRYTRVHLLFLILVTLDSEEQTKII